MKLFVMREMMMSDGMKLEIDELDQRVETLFENINKLKGC